MKTLLLLILIAIAVSCGKPKEYNLTVNVKGASELVKLQKLDKSGWTVIDSTNTNNGICNFKGKLQNPDAYYLDFGNRKRLLVFLENAQISITGTIDSLHLAEVSGSTIHDEYLESQKPIKLISNKMDNLYGEWQKANENKDEAKKEEVRSILEMLYGEEENQKKSYIRNNPSSYVSPYYLGEIFYSMEADTLESYLNYFDSSLESVGYVIRFRDRVEKLKTVAIGQIAPEFSMLSPDSVYIQLSDIYKNNEYTLIDFWASWCGPCRRENPNVVGVFNDYKDKGFGVFGISLDNNKERWLEAVEKDQLDWPHVSDLRGWKNAAAKLYAVNSIPANLLVDSKGKIVARNIREKALREKVSELLDFKK